MRSLTQIAVRPERVNGVGFINPKVELRLMNTLAWYLCDNQKEIFALKRHSLHPFDFVNRTKPAETAIGVKMALASLRAKIS